MTVVIEDPFRMEVRENIGGGASRALRRTHMIPGVVYGGGKPNAHVVVDPRDVVKGLNTKGFYSHLYNITVGKEKERVLVRDVQMHPVKDVPMHIDFWRVAKGAKIHVNIPVRFINEDKCPALKQGGRLNVVLHSLEVTCSVDAIPEEVVVDLDGLQAGDAIHTENLKMEAGARVTHPDRDITVATLVAPAGAAEAEEATA